MSQNFELCRHLPTLLSLWRGNKKATAPLSQRELDGVSSSLLALQRGLTGERQLVGASYMEKRGYLGAYLLYYWPVSYMQLSFALQSLGQPQFSRPLRVLDLGCGPAPAAAAVCDCFPVATVQLVDSSPKALQLARELFATDFQSDNRQIDVQTEVCNIKTYNPAETYDFIVMSHALNELWAGEAEQQAHCTELAARLASVLSPEGILLLVEPALQETSRLLLGIRDGLLSSQKGLHILSPCPAGATPCPALNSGTQSCHAEATWEPVEPVASLAQQAGLERKSVKMSFCAFSRRERQEGNKLRVVSDAMLNKAGRLRYLLCDGKRRIALSAKKEDTHAKSTGFFSLKRYDMLELRNPELRGDREAPAYAVGKDTGLAITRFS